MNLWLLFKGPKDPGLEDLRLHLHQLLLLPLHKLHLLLLFLYLQQPQFFQVPSLRAFHVYDAEAASGPARPGVQPSPLGEGEASTAQETQPDQEDDILEALEPTSLEPFIF